MNHKTCPPGSHRPEVGEATVTVTCSVEGSSLVLPRCPAITKARRRCAQAVARDLSTCWIHSPEGRRYAIEVWRPRLQLAKAGRATGRLT